MAKSLAGERGQNLATGLLLGCAHAEAGTGPGTVPLPQSSHFRNVNSHFRGVTGQFSDREML